MTWLEMLDFQLLAFVQSTCVQLPSNDVANLFSLEK